MFGTCIGQLLHHITFERSRFYNVIIRVLGIEHRESLVMTSSEANIFSSGSLDGCYPFVCIKLRRIESPGQFGILFIIQVIVCHRPLSGSEHGIESPMKEDSKLIVLNSKNVIKCFFISIINKKASLRASPEREGGRKASF